MKKRILTSFTMLLGTGMIIGSGGNIAIGRGDFKSSFEPVVTAFKLLPSRKTLSGNNLYELKTPEDFEKADYTFKGFKVPRTYNDMEKELGMAKLSNSFYTTNKYETNVKKADLTFLNYKFNYDSKIGSLNISIQNVKSESIRTSAGLGAYFSASYGVNVEVDVELGISAGSTDSVILGVNYNMDNMPSGNYGVYLRFYTCTKYYFKVVNSKVTEILEVKNSPSVIYGYEFIKE